MVHKKLHRYLCDLHIHTALSPCASDEMSPAGILLEALDKGLDVIGICDHNSAKNLRPLVELSSVAGITVFCGMEIQTEEEVHILCFFNGVKEALDFQSLVYSRLPEEKNVREYFGSQLIFGCDGDLIGEEKRLLLTSVNMSIEAVCTEVSMRGGLVIPSHVDRMAFGLLGVLGVIPEGLDVPALEISRTLSPREARARWREMEEYRLITSSDAHCLEDIGLGKVEAFMDHLSISELNLALRGIGGRKVVIPGN
jgi:PHP family Zn ribbon phosphoesterase